MPPSLMPKLGKAGSLQSRQAIVHSLVHTESWAIDLSWVLFCLFLSLFLYCLRALHFIAFLEWELRRIGALVGHVFVYVLLNHVQYITTKHVIVFIKKKTRHCGETALWKFLGEPSFWNILRETVWKCTATHRELLVGYNTKL